MNEQNKVAEILKELSVCYQRMLSLRPLKESELSYFYREFALSASHNSNAIEGNHFTFDETKLLIEKGIVTGAHSLRESEDILGYKQAFDYLYVALKAQRPVDEEFIKKLHSFVLRGEEDAGEYRRIQNYVGSLTRIVYTLCPPAEVPAKMQSFVLGVQKDLEKYLLKRGEEPDFLSLFHMLAGHHIRFENVHPFLDGNGRTGRLLLCYEMISLGLLPVDIRYEERERYYAAIKHYHGKEKYSSRDESKTEKQLAKLLLECELASMKLWLNTFEG